MLDTYFSSVALFVSLPAGQLAPVIIICGRSIIFNSFMKVSMFQFLERRPQAMRNILALHFRPPKEVNMTCLIFRDENILVSNGAWSAVSDVLLFSVFPLVRCLLSETVSRGKKSTHHLLHV